MTRDEKIYFSLLRIGLGTESPREILPELAKLQWGEIYRLAVRQGTGALIWDALRQLHAMEYLPLSLRVQWAYNVEQIEDRYRKQEKVLAGLSKFYASHSISLMLLKGYGLSFCYPCPEHRECGDIDIWLLVDSVKRTSCYVVNGEFGSMKTNTIIQFFSSTELWSKIITTF